MDNIVEFFMDPLRLTLIIAGVVVLLAIIVFSRKSNKHRDFIHSSPSSKEFSFGSQINTNHPIGSVSDALSSEMLTDEEVIVLPRRKTESELAREAVEKAQEPVFTSTLNNVPETDMFGETEVEGAAQEKYVFSPVDENLNGDKPLIKEFTANTSASNTASSTPTKANTVSDTKRTVVDDVIERVSKPRAAAFEQISSHERVHERVKAQEPVTNSAMNSVNARVKASVHSTGNSSAKEAAVKEKPASSIKVESSIIEKANQLIAKKSKIDNVSTKPEAEVQTAGQLTQAALAQTARPTQKTPAQTEPTQKTKQQATQKRAKEKYVVLHILANEKNVFNGLDILEATKTLGLAFGKHAIFHYPMSAAPAGDSKFCLVNMSPTGNFETNKISSLETHGISLIMSLPIRGADSLTVFSNMVGVAQALARKLGGNALDQTRAPLTAEIIENLRADIEYFEAVANQAKAAESVVEA